MKNTANAERPMSAMVYWPSRSGPCVGPGDRRRRYSVRRSGIPGPSPRHRVKDRAASPGKIVIHGHPNRGMPRTVAYSTHPEWRGGILGTSLWTGELFRYASHSHLEPLAPMPGYCGACPSPLPSRPNCGSAASILAQGEDVTALTQSYFHRASATPLLNDPLGGALDKAAERWPDQEAVVVRDQDARLTFAALRHEANRLATGLIALGLKPGDRVGLWSPNRIEWVLTQYATAKAGLILVNINPGYRAAELEYALNKVACRALISS